MKELVLCLLSGGAAAAIVKLIDNVIIRMMDKKSAKNAVRLEDIKISLDDVNATIDKISEEQNSIIGGLRILLSQRLNIMILEALNNDEITMARRREIIKTYDIYHSLGGNGDFDELLQKVMALKIVG